VVEVMRHPAPPIPCPNCQAQAYQVVSEDQIVFYSCPTCGYASEPRRHNYRECRCPSCGADALSPAFRTANHKLTWPGRQPWKGETEKDIRSAYFFWLCDDCSWQSPPISLEVETADEPTQP
jgi:hypothetical protein